MCFANTRILAPRRCYDEVVDFFTAMAQSLTIGDPLDPNTQVGPLVNAAQLRKVERYIQQGLADGGTVTTGGKRASYLPNGYFIEPTVFAGLDNHSAVAREEIFGPVLTVIAYDDEDDAIRIANDTEYGLHAYVSGTDMQRARRVASQIQAGRVAINGMLDDQQAPFGGFKHSGVGREFGTFGIEALSNHRAILE